MSDHIWDFIGHVFEQILVGQCLMTNSYLQPWTQVNTQTTHQQQNITLSSFVDCFNKIMNYFDIRIKLNPSLWNSSVQRMPKGKGSGWRMRKRQKKKQEHNITGLHVRLCHQTALHSTEYTCTCIEYNLPLSPNYSCQ